MGVEECWVLSGVVAGTWGALELLWLKREMSFMSIRQVQASSGQMESLAEANPGSLGPGLVGRDLAEHGLMISGTLMTQHSICSGSCPASWSPGSAPSSCMWMHTQPLHCL